MVSSLTGQPGASVANSVSVFQPPFSVPSSTPVMRVCLAPSGQPSHVSSLGYAPTMSVSSASQSIPIASLGGRTPSVSIGSASAGQFTLMPSLGPRLLFPLL